MENASRALVMAGAILIGVLIISGWVFFYQKMGASTTKILNRNQQLEVNEFNNKLLMINSSNGNVKKGEATYIGDLITVIHYAQNVNLKAQREVQDGSKLVDITIRTPGGTYTLDSLFENRAGRNTKISENYKKLIQETTINVQNSDPKQRALVTIDLGSIKTTDDGRITNITYVVKYETL